jgi:HAD superfamily hydrolase (TIGR01509 family)
MIDLSRFSAIVFDFDGVIADSESLQCRAWNRLAVELGVDRTVDPGYIVGRLDRDIGPELFPHVDAKWCLDRKYEHEMALINAGELQAIAHIDRLLDRVIQTHKIAICSSSERDVIEDRLDRLGLRKYFNLIVGRYEVTRHKPLPDPYLKAIELLGEPTEKICVIEDSPTGVMAARAANLFTIQLLHDGIPRAEGANEVIRSYEELLNAD